VKCHALPFGVLCAAFSRHVYPSLSAVAVFPLRVRSLDASYNDFSSVVLDGMPFLE
jgi:hypothetical protein